MIDEVECPGCRDCGTNCDEWMGKHFWLDYADIGRLGLYSMCDFCGKKEFHD